MLTVAIWVQLQL